MRRYGMSVHFDDGTCWPVPGEDLVELQWRLRYKDHAPDSDKLSAASVVSAYDALIALPQRERNKRISLIRTARNAPDQRALASPPATPGTGVARPQKACPGGIAHCDCANWESGYVCLRCVGTRFVSSPPVPCPACRPAPTTPETPREPKIRYGTKMPMVTAPRGYTPHAPATPPPQFCAAWCGTRWDKHDHGSREVRFQRDDREHCYCTPACRDAGHPMNPRTPREPEKSKP